MVVEGSWEDRVFDERELKFEVGDGESLGLPAGVEKAITAMEQEEEALFTLKPKYVCFHTRTCLLGQNTTSVRASADDRHL